MKKLKSIKILLMVMIFMSYSTNAFANENPQGKKDIVDTAIQAGDFNILAAALEKAGLVDTLKKEGPFTVFAPTDESFQKLLNELGITKEQLLERKDLKKILLYHVVTGKVMSRDLKDGMKIKTLAKKKVKISLDPPRVNDAKIIKKDIQASNGVIHVIDKVLLPKE